MKSLNFKLTKLAKYTIIFAYFISITTKIYLIPQELDDFRALLFAYTDFKSCMLTVVFCSSGNLNKYSGTGCSPACFAAFKKQGNSIMY